MPEHILGIGAAALDYVLKVSEEFMSTLPGERGGMEYIDHERFNKIINEVGKGCEVTVGGCTTNKLKGLARLGHSCTLLGMIGTDEEARHIAEKLEDYKIQSLFSMSSTPTTRVACLVEDDGRRTFRTFPGASVEFTADHLDAELFTSANIVIIEGYSIVNPGLVERAMHLAKQSGAKVIFDLACLEFCKTYKGEMLLLLEQYVDIVFANRREAHTLFEMDAEEACKELCKYVDIAVVSMSEKGCWVGSANGVSQYDANPVKPYDTTGAGDLFAAGFLHGYLKGEELSRCAEMGAILAAEVVQVSGTDIPKEKWEDLSARVFE